MGLTLGIASYKGGVGKTSVSLGIASSLADMGKKVCLVDCSYGGDLDIMLGCQDDVVFCLSDITDPSWLKKAVVKVGGMDFYAAPSSLYDISLPISIVLDTLDDYDYMIFDNPRDICTCDRVIMVTSPDDGAVRCAEMLGAECRTKGISTSLVVNRLPLFEGVVTHVSPIIDRTFSYVIGAIPFMWGYTEKERNVLYRAVYKNIALRIEGEQLPLFEGLKNKKKFQNLVK